MAQPFIQYKPKPEDFWRGIVMYGRNVASYKFALAKSLIELSPHPGQLIGLDELAVPFSHHICEHLKTADKQSTAPASKFLDACRKANNGEITQDKLINTTVKLGFVNVIDAFHVIGDQSVECKFFIDERSLHKGIRISDNFGKLAESRQFLNLGCETEARWNLVETAWELGVSRSLIAVKHDDETNLLFAIDSNRRRKSITSARSALSGYQKGHCFYCFRSFGLLSTEPPDVDHFFPHALKESGFQGVDGIWNLVLACTECNRGVGGKFHKIPSLRLLERLNTRNEFLIASQHPLKETLIAQTGTTEQLRRQFLNECYKEAVSRLLNQWEPIEVNEALF